MNTDLIDDMVVLRYEMEWWTMSGHVKIMMEMYNLIQSHKALDH